MTTATQWAKAEDGFDADDTSHATRAPDRGNLSGDKQDWEKLGKMTAGAERTYSELKDIGDVELVDAPEGPDQAVKNTATDEDAFEMEVDNSMGNSTAGSRWWGEGTFNPSLRAFASGDDGSNLSTTFMPPDTVRITVQKSDSKLVMDVEGDNAMLCAQIKPELKRLCSKYASFSGSTIDLSDPWERVEAMIGGNIPVSVLQSGANIEYSRSPALDDACCQHVATALTSPE